MSAGLRDAQGRRIPDELEWQAAAAAAERDTGMGRVVTGRDLFLRAAGQDPEPWVDQAAVEVDLAERQSLNRDAGWDVRAQLEALHTHTPGVVLDFTRTVYDSAGEAHTDTDHNKLAQFNARLKAQAAALHQGPGSGVAMWRDGRWQGDPGVVARSEQNDALRARMEEQMQARMEAAGIRFAGPYNIFNSVK
jgi:hypothetical protein